MNNAVNQMDLLVSLLFHRARLGQQFRLTIGRQEFLVFLAECGESTQLSNHQSQISNHQKIEYEPVINLSLAGFRYYDANTGRGLFASTATVQPGRPPATANALE